MALQRRGEVPNTEVERGLEASLYAKGQAYPFIDAPGLSIIFLELLIA